MSDFARLMEEVVALRAENAALREKLKQYEAPADKAISQDTTSVIAYGHISSIT